MVKMHDLFMKVAFLIAGKSKCVSHHVGAVLVKDNRIVSMGYNGAPPGLINCNEVFNPDSFDRHKHHEWSDANEVHAEINCLMFAAKNEISTDGCDLYVTITPCDYCVKNVVMSGVKNIFYLYEYDLIQFNGPIRKAINIERLELPEVKEFVEKNGLLYKPKGRN